MIGKRTVIFFFNLIFFCINAIAQQAQFHLYVFFNEAMDTTGFSNPANFKWTNGLQTLNVQLVDTAKALLTVSQPEVYVWYKLTVSNVYDISGNLISSESDTAGCLWKEVPFPVELSSFTAKLVNDKVKLEWITETEVNNYGFDVERKVNQDEWQKIGFVEGHGNSNSQKIYNFIDDRLIGGSKFNYRLKQIDTDGQFEYSDVIEIENIPMNFALFQNYPNPFNPSTKISFSIPIQERVTIRVFDVLGRQVEELMNDVKSPGYYSIIFNAADLPSATYFYEIRAGSFFETKKMLLIR